MSEHGLPRGWTAATLADITEINPKCWSEDPCDDTLVSFIPMAAVEEENGRINLGNVREWRAVSKGYTRFQEGDVIFAKITPCMENGKSAVARGLQGGRATGSTEFHVLRPTSAISADLLRYFLVQSDVRNRARMYMKGAAGQLRVSPEYLRALDFLLPPRLEQDRIVSEIETLLSDLDAAVAGLKRVQANLKRYRASVLKAACEGRLVPTEAELARKEGRNYESGEQLLQHILKERRIKWEADQLAKMQASGRLPKDGWKKKYKEPAPPDTTSLAELPEGWTWATADQLCTQITDGEHIQPPYKPEGRPMLTATHVRDGYVEFDNFGLIGELAFANAIKRCAPEADDIVIVSVGATTGRAAIVGDFGPFAIVRSVLLLKAAIPTNPIYLLNWIRSPWCQDWVRTASGSSAQAHLYISDTKSLPVPLPPAPEMVRIANECADRLSIVEANEHTLKVACARASRLRQSILKRAFEGKLVPQDTNDEPASVLLERIRAERAASAVSSRSGRNTVAHGVSRGKKRSIKTASPRGA